MGAFETIVRICNECWISRCLHAAVLLRFADIVGDEPRTIDDIAQSSKVDRHVVGAILAVLSRRGIFSLQDGRVEQTELSNALRSDRPGAATKVVEWMGSDEVWDALGRLPHLNGEARSAFEAAYETRLFDYLKANPDRASLFEHHIAAFTEREVALVIGHLDVAPFETFLDLGSGSGRLARALYDLKPTAQVWAFDLPSNNFHALDDCPAVHQVTGDFFKDPLPPAELTILSNILHDWPDSGARHILEVIRASARPGHCLYVIEGLADADEEKVDMVNIGMAVMTGGRQRTRKEYEDMLSEVGSEVYDEIKCSPYTSILKARFV